MTTTGYNDTFQRTVSSNWGTATSGQSYTLAGTASAFSVSSGVGSIAATASGNWLAYIDRQTSDIDITGQVALSAVPSTNLSTVGFTAKQQTNQNYYIGSLMVQTLGIMNVRISKVVAGALVTLNTTLVPGLGTYTAGTYLNLRFQCYWSNELQTNVLNIKVWAVGGTEPGGWLATTTDASFTQYTAGTQAGAHVRDEATTPNNTGRFQNVVARSYNLPMPATTDPMCADPAVAYPKQPMLESLALAADTAMVAIDPLSSLASLYPRVRVSSTSVSVPGSGNLTFNTTEFNIGTPTNLGYDNTALYLSVGIWLVAFEIQMAEFGSAFTIQLGPHGSSPQSGQVLADMRSNTAHSNDQSTGGTAHFSALTFASDPVVPITYGVSFSGISSNTYTVNYMALSAIKISDYFT